MTTRAQAGNETGWMFDPVRGTWIPPRTTDLHVPSILQRYLTSYVPGTTEHSTSNRGITIGNGTQVAGFSRIGKWCRASYKLTFGSTSALDAMPEAVAFGLPFPSKPGQETAVGSSWFRDDAPVRQHYVGTGILVDTDADGNGTRFRFNVPNVAGDKVGYFTENSGISLANGAATFISWNGQTVDRDNMLTPTSNTATIRTDGMYYVSAFVGSSTNRSDWIRAQIGILQNGVNWLALQEWSMESAGGYSHGAFWSVSTTCPLSNTDTLQVRVFQTNVAAASITTGTGALRSRFGIVRLSDHWDNVTAEVNSKNPFTWATDDILTGSVIYEVADGY